MSELNYGTTVAEAIRVGSNGRSGAGSSESPRTGVDLVLLATVALLAGFGVVMVYSASSVYSRQKFSDAEYFVRRHLIFVVLGLCSMGFFARFPYQQLRRYVYPLLGTAIVLLIAVLIPGLGSRAGGAARWLHLGPFGLQPGEVAKFALILYLAHVLAKKAERVRDFTVGFLPPLVIAGLLAVLSLRQPDLGTAAILFAVTLTLLFVAGAKLSALLLVALVAAPVAYQQIVGTAWRMKRIMAFINPWPYRHDIGYQVTESLISIGSGGATGLGLGDGRQKLFFLPEAHTDFIVSIVGEELGFVGVCLLLLAFSVLVWRGVRAAVNSTTAFGTYLAFGITVVLGLQAAINMAVVMGVVPTKGLTLPFVSYGGTSLMVSLGAVGVLLNISSQPRRSSLSSDPGDEIDDEAYEGTPSASPSVAVGSALSPVSAARSSS